MKASSPEVVKTARTHASILAGLCERAQEIREAGPGSFSRLRPSLSLNLTLLPPNNMGDGRDDERTDAVGEEEKKARGASKDERGESEGDRSPESGPMGTDHGPAPGGPMGTEDKHEEEAGSRVGEEDD